jgi:hypothetical protein
LDSKNYKWFVILMIAMLFALNLPEIIKSARGEASSSELTQIKQRLDALEKKVGK